MTMIDVFNTIKTQTTKLFYGNMVKFGYTMLSVMSSIEICFKNSVFHKLWLLFTELFYRKYTYTFIKNGKISQVRYEYDSYSYYIPENTFDFLIFSNGIFHRIIKNTDQPVCYGKPSTEVLTTPYVKNIWFSSTLYYTIDNKIHTLPIEFNTTKYNYLLSENVFDNLFIEYFVKKHYNVDIKNSMYSIDILHMNFQIETFNRNKLISLQNILKKQM
jgi:hypothetical protein